MKTKDNTAVVEKDPRLDEGTGGVLATIPKETTAVASMSDLFEAAGGAGRDFAPDELAIPYLGVLQKMSPQCDEDQPDKFMKEARPGMIYNNVTKELHDGREKGLVIVPAGYTHSYVEWIPRNSGGGFVATYKVDDPIIRMARIVEDSDGKKRLKLPNGNDLVETMLHYAVYKTEGGVPRWAVISMTSSQLKISRAWCKIQDDRPERTKGGKRYPVYAYQYLFKTKPEKKGDKVWSGWDVSLVGLVDDPETFALAQKFFDGVNSGTVRVGAPPTDDVQDAAEKVPF